jgi:hypothetical protein
MNNAPSQRRIFKGASTTQSAIRELLTIVFCQELLSPGAALFIVAPWISNVVVFDNRSAHFSAINPEWGEREIGIVDVLIQLARSGTTVKMAVRPEDHNQQFIRTMREASEEEGVGDKIAISEIENLHTKGILADSWVILGSMNLTRNGIEINEEYLTYEIGRPEIAQARIHFDRLLLVRS